MLYYAKRQYGDDEDDESSDSDDRPMKIYFHQLDNGTSGLHGSGRGKSKLEEKVNDLEKEIRRLKNDTNKN